MQRGPGPAEDQSQDLLLARKQCFHHCTIVSPCMHAHIWGFLTSHCDAGGVVGGSKSCDHVSLFPRTAREAYRTVCADKLNLKLTPHYTNLRAFP